MNGERSGGCLPRRDADQVLRGSGAAVADIHLISRRSSVTACAAVVVFSVTRSTRERLLNIRTKDERLKTTKPWQMRRQYSCSPQKGVLEMEILQGK